MAEKNSKNAKLKKIIKVLGTLLFLGILIYNVDLIESVRILRETNILLYFVGFLLFLFNLFLSSWRWNLMLKGLGFNLPPAKLYELYVYGYFFNRILPSSIGGDATKIYKLRETTGKGTEVSITTATLMERVLGALAIFILIILAAVLHPDLEQNIKFLLVAGSLVPPIIFLLIFSLKKNHIFPVLRKLVPGQKISNVLNKIEESRKTYSKKKMLLLQGLGVSLVLQFLGIVVQYIMFQAVHIDVAFSALAVTIPISRLITALPISIGGLGLREVSLAALLQNTGVSKLEVISFSIASRASIIPLIIIALTYVGIKKLRQREGNS